MAFLGYVPGCALIIVAVTALVYVWRILVRALKSGTLELRDEDAKAETPVHQETNAGQFWFWWIFFAAIATGVAAGFIWTGIQWLQRAYRYGLNPRAVVPLLLVVLAVVVLMAWRAWRSWAQRGKQDTDWQLRWANVRRTDLSQSDLSDADLSQANLCEANLRVAKVTDEQLAQAKILKGATLPDGTVHE